jgi:hypothetical protein
MLHAFFANGVDKLHPPWVVEALLILLQLSLSLFLAGLLIFLFNANQTAFNTVAGWVTLFGGIYACITFMPIFRHDSLFYTPLSSMAWFPSSSAIEWTACATPPPRIHAQCLVASQSITGTVATNIMMERVPTVCVQARTPREVQPTGTASGTGAVADAMGGNLDMTFVKASVRGVRVND